MYYRCVTLYYFVKKCQELYTPNLKQNDELQIGTKLLQID